MVPNKVLLDTTLSAKALRLFEVLEHHSGGHHTCWPGYPALAEEVGCSVKWVAELADMLVKAGYLHVEYRQGKTNIYTLLLRVERPQKPTHEVGAPVVMKSTTYEQKQPTKTNNKGGSTPLKGNIDFKKYLPGGAYAKLTAPIGS